MLDFSYNQLSGTVPSWVKDSQLNLNLVTNNFVVHSSGKRLSISGSDNSVYESDDASLGATSFYVTGAQTWGVSNVGRFMDAPDGNYIIYSSHEFLNTSDTYLLRNARMSPSSLRYFGIGLENGNYAVTLQFAEFDFPDGQTWKSNREKGFRYICSGNLTLVLGSSTLFLSRRTFLRFISSGLARALAAFLLKATTGLRSQL
ncbi:putative LRR receptor-like serine/threonine-protein kinase [Hordeum vulgare]|nr:putative LRR receptor-like serine/threonine-protein kinase [Hordeum vulgare]